MDKKKKALRILLVDENPSGSQGLQKLLEDWGHQVDWSANGDGALQKLSNEPRELVIADTTVGLPGSLALIRKIKKRFPEVVVFSITGDDFFKSAKRALSMGADDYLLKPINPNQLDIALSKAAGKLQLKHQIADLEKFVENKFSTRNIVAHSKSMQNVLRQIDRASQSMEHVWIFGEKGTGKELAARAIFHPLAIKKAPFISFNCRAATRGKIERELLGHSPATGDLKIGSKGAISQAIGGALFLDEICEFPLYLQKKLPGILDYMNAPDDFLRVFATTDNNPLKEIKAGRLEKGLFNRLNTFSLYLPPLRERREDIPTLVGHFFKKYEKKFGQKQATSNALDWLMNHPFPGNVRELENLILRGMAAASGQEVGLLDFNPPAAKSELIKSFSAQGKGKRSYQWLKKKIKMMEGQFLTQQLSQNGGNVARSATLLGMTRTALHNRIKVLEINLNKFRKED